MVTKEDVIYWLKCISGRSVKCEECKYRFYPLKDCNKIAAEDTITLLKAQEIATIATIDPKPIKLEDETKKWLNEMDGIDALKNIADICIDWDGYRTANGLGGLINEIWAYARYCSEKLKNDQEEQKGDDIE